MNISKETKRNIIDTLRVENIQWHGALDEISFLERVFNLDELRGYIDVVGAVSHDIRTEINEYLNNPDRYNWNFYNDQRFNLIDKDDETFLKFLYEMLHPIVRPDEVEVLQLVKIFNQYLYLDGWEIHELTRVGNKPTFCARQLPQYPINKSDRVLEILDAPEIRRTINNMESSIESNPESAIGSAKNFIETICKWILNEKEIVFNEKNIDFLELFKLTRKQLKLLREDVSDSVKGAEDIRNLLSNLCSIPEYLVKIRNDYGDGHGKNAYFNGLQPKEARLTVNAAIALGVYLLETYHENKG